MGNMNSNRACNGPGSFDRGILMRLGYSQADFSRAKMIEEKSLQARAIRTIM